MFLVCDGGGQSTINFTRCGRIAWGRAQAERRAPSGQLHHRARGPTAPRCLITVTSSGWSSGTTVQFAQTARSFSLVVFPRSASTPRENCRTLSSSVTHKNCRVFVHFILSVANVSFRIFYSYPSLMYTSTVHSSFVFTLIIYFTKLVPWYCLFHSHSLFEASF